MSAAGPGCRIRGDLISRSQPFRTAGIASKPGRAATFDGTNFLPHHDPMMMSGCASITACGVTMRSEADFFADNSANTSTEIPELPGAMADGATRREALANAETIIQEWIDTARGAGTAYPGTTRQADDDSRSRRAFGAECCYGETVLYERQVTRAEGGQRLDCSPAGCGAICCVAATSRTQARRFSLDLAALFFLGNCLAAASICLCLISYNDVHADPSQYLDLVRVPPADSAYFHSLSPGICSRLWIVFWDNKDKIHFTTKREN